MKHVITLLSLLLIYNAAKSEGKLIGKHGVKLGLTLAAQSFSRGTSSYVTGRRVGINAGYFVEWFDASMISVVTQLEYAQRGQRDVYVQTFEGRTWMTTSRLDDLSLPILAKLSTKEKVTSVYAVVGPRIDFLVGSQTDAEEFRPILNEFKKVILGASIGGGMEFNNVGFSQLFVEVRYNMDLQDSYRSNRYAIRNNAVDFWLGIVW
jgi:hypothetical protein